MGGFPRSVPHLLAMASGLDCVGEHRCFYCCAPCGEDHPASQYVKSSFTGRNEVPAPGSAWVCAGCVPCLRESADIAMIDGEARAGQMMRGYSWLVTPAAALAATKTHLDRLRATCLGPPDPPWALVLSDSGQKHLLYRGVVNRDAVNRDAGGECVVTLEGERVAYRPADLADLLRVAGHYCAATGKPALSEAPSVGGAMRVIERYRDGEAIVDRWGRAWSTPVGRLAAWLCMNKELCDKEYPSDVERDDEPAAAPAGPGRGGVPAEAGRAGGSAGAARRGRKPRQPQGCGQPTLFDLG